MQSLEFASTAGLSDTNNNNDDNSIALKSDLGEEKPKICESTRKD